MTANPLSTSAPFFSVVIPTYNRANFIAETLRSVLAQEFQAFEIIVVDDGSTDNTAEIIARFVGPQVRYLPKQNSERGAARNYGFKRAHGEYVIFLDSDDVLLPNHLTVIHDKIQALTAPKFIASKYNFNRDGVLTDSDMAGIPEGWYGIDLFVGGQFLSLQHLRSAPKPSTALV